MFNPRRKNNPYLAPLIFLVWVTVILAAVPRSRSAALKVGLFFFRPAAGLVRQVARLPDQIWQTLGDKRKMAGELDRLNKKFAELKLENEILRQAAAENDRLRALLAWQKQNSRYQLTPAEVIGFVPEQWLNKAIINKGWKQGLAVGQGLINQSGVVGRVIEVKDQTAIVLLFTDTTSSVGAVCQRTGDQGLVVGRLCFPPLVKYIPQGNDVRPGDIFVTAPGSRYFPAGLPIGKVVKKISLPYELFDEIYLRPAVQVSQINYVFVVAALR